MLTPTDPEALSARHVRDFVMCGPCFEFLERSRREVGVGDTGIGGVAVRFCVHNGVAGVWFKTQVHLLDCPTPEYFEHLVAQYTRIIERQDFAETRELAQ
jgi:hypothetical protein